ncbi:MAG: histidine phosphatase family protein [Spirochaetales bacterium]|nr:histidine phosphatase family protein [Spirochaetales bacterium]
MNFKKMKNKYFIFRHGNSEANIENLIISDLDSGVLSYGLTEFGIKQVEMSINDLISKNSIKNPVVVASPFKRTVETATIICNKLNIKTPIINDKLRERYFGKFNISDSINYEKIWSMDVMDPESSIWGVESVNEVSERLHKLFVELEDQYNNSNIILVSHGDPLQILECMVSGKNIGEHRSINPINQGEYRKLIIRI